MVPASNVDFTSLKGSLRFILAIVQLKIQYYRTMMLDIDHVNKAMDLINSINAVTWYFLWDRITTWKIHWSNIHFWLNKRKNGLIHVTVSYWSSVIDREKIVESISLLIIEGQLTNGDCGNYKSSAK